MVHSYGFCFSLTIINTPTPSVLPQAAFTWRAMVHSDQASSTAQPIAYQPDSRRDPSSNSTVIKSLAAIVWHHKSSQQQTTTWQQQPHKGNIREINTYFLPPIPHPKQQPAHSFHLAPYSQGMLQGSYLLIYPWGLCYPPTVIYPETPRKFFSYRLFRVSFYKLQNTLISKGGGSKGERGRFVHSHPPPSCKEQSGSSVAQAVGLLGR